jgi:hypothetical protein
VELKIDLLGLEEYINCFLVSEGVRKGYLFQMINYKEYSIDDPISHIKLKRMKQFFPHLYFLPNKQGVLISTTSYTLDDINTDAKLGEILGFPCELPRADDKIKYVFDIKIIQFQESPVSIITFVSPNPDPLDYVQTITKTIRDLLFEDNELINIIEDVTYSSVIIHPTKYFINRLLDKNHKFTEMEILDIENYWYNTIGEYRIDEFRYLLYDDDIINNDIVRGLIIGLLTYSDNCPLSLFSITGFWCTKNKRSRKKVNYGQIKFWIS